MHQPRLLQRGGKRPPAPLPIDGQTGGRTAAPRRLQGPGPADRNRCSSGGNAVGSGTLSPRRSAPLPRQRSAALRPPRPAPPRLSRRPGRRWSGGAGLKHPAPSCAHRPSPRPARRSGAARPQPGRNEDVPGGQQRTAGPLSRGSTGGRRRRRHPRARLLPPVGDRSALGDGRGSQAWSRLAAAAPAQAGGSAGCREPRTHSPPASPRPSFPPHPGNSHSRPRGRRRSGRLRASPGAGCGMKGTRGAALWLRGVLRPGAAPRPPLAAACGASPAARIHFPLILAENVP